MVASVPLVVSNSKFIPLETRQDKIVWGIIGCGNVAEVKSGPAFQKCNGSELLAVMRRDAEKAEDFARRHQVPLWYDTASELLANAAITAVYIATPPSSHLKLALQALEARKDVYLEKPMVLSVKEALILKKAVQESSNKLVVAHYRRHLPMYLKVKDLIDSNSIGTIQCADIKFFRAHRPDSDWRLDASISGGGYFQDIAPHQIDLMYHFFGEYDSVKGFAINPETNYAASDTVNGIMAFKNGVQFRGIWNFNAAHAAEKDNCTIYGSNGYISFSFFGNEVVVVSDENTSTFDFKHPEHIQQPFIQETVDYFLGKRDNPCTVEEGLMVNEVMETFSNKINII